MNPEFSEYEVEVSTSRLRRSVRSSLEEFRKIILRPTGIATLAACIPESLVRIPNLSVLSYDIRFYDSLLPYLSKPAAFLDLRKY
jgi:hypothetical protein